MKKALLILLLCGFNLAIAADKNTFTKKFERKMAAASSQLKFGKKVSAQITVEVAADGSARVIDLQCDSEKEGQKLRTEIEKMEFSDTTCAGTHTLKLSIIPQR